MRPPFRDIYIELAKLMAKRSTCKRLQVGCVITSIDFRQVLAVGYNGGACGDINTCDTDEPGNCGCVHSEINCVANCDSPRYIDKYIFVTTLPCVMCAKVLVNMGGVKKIFFQNEYRILKSIEIFKNAGIEVVKL